MPNDSEPREPSCVLIRNEMGGIVAAHGEVFVVLGWDAEEIVGLSSTALIHPEDQTGAITAWLQMLDTPGASMSWRGRYRARAGTWRWVESLNINNLDDPSDPRVTSSLRPVAAEEVGIEEELRSRKQLISRLSDSLPVGLFQIDLRRHLTFTNDRLHVILQTPDAATVEAQFAAVHPDDHDIPGSGAHRRPRRRTGRRPRASLSTPHRRRQRRAPNPGVSAEPPFLDRQHRGRHRGDRLCERRHRQCSTPARASDQGQRRRADGLPQPERNPRASRTGAARTTRRTATASPSSSSTSTTSRPSTTGTATQQVTQSSSPGRGECEPGFAPRTMSVGSAEMNSSSYARGSPVNGMRST